MRSKRSSTRARLSRARSSRRRLRVSLSAGFAGLLRTAGARAHGGRNARDAHLLRARRGEVPAISRWCARRSRRASWRRDRAPRNRLRISRSPRHSCAPIAARLSTRSSRTTPRPPWQRCWCGRSCSARLPTWAHTILAHELESYAPLRFAPALRRLGARIDRHLARRADAVIALTRAGERALARHAHGPVLCIPPDSRRAPRPRPKRSPLRASAIGSKRAATHSTREISTAIKISRRSPLRRSKSRRRWSSQPTRRRTRPRHSAPYMLRTPTKCACSLSAQA